MQKAPIRSTDSPQTVETVLEEVGLTMCTRLYLVNKVNLTFFVIFSNIIFSIYDFFAAKPQKNKYRWFKVVRFGGGGLVGRWWWWPWLWPWCHKGICL